jgi:hypothetical protein
MADTYCITFGSDGYGAFRDCSMLLSEPTRTHVLAVLLADLNQRAVDAFTGFAVHAGVARLGDRIVAVPADSGGGKSTLTAALVLTGFEYLSDEALCVEYDTATVVPYPKPIHLAPWSRRALDLEDDRPVETAFEKAFTATDLDSRVGGPGRLTDVVFPAFGESSDPNLAPIARSAAQATLLKLSFNHYKNPEGAFRLSSELVRGAECWELTYSDPMQAAEFLADHLSI